MSQTTERVLPGRPVVLVTTAQGHKVPVLTRPKRTAVRRKGQARSTDLPRPITRSGAVSAAGTSATGGRLVVAVVTLVPAAPAGLLDAGAGDHARRLGRSMAVRVAVVRAGSVGVVRLV